ncbi:uncharacterized protein LOC133849248 isoform X2 [Drosophila sulfurigaster albostrigata]|uniref:uncharacterized protein LOC133849248 isoform X2 n=1 Tax=Drosophila sulfurigaster albostrigata TaxID=89887 RepID=UPI002D21A119|nr:uncharacterized protein LOC133849248 isoform X2 [Drosophila sulfurigaster albostrigata]
MFNFHKPRVYRSTDGCCICRAKSSSSRFTASRKYEKESMQCFNLHEPRNGEICNACVLLVKRYKRLPVGSKRHWGHVVDARAGPGTKSLAKQKKRDNDSDATSGGGSSSSLPEKFAKIFKKNRKGKITAATTATASPSIDRELQLQQQLLCKERSPHSEDQPSDSNESNDDEQLQLQHVATTVAATTPYQTRKRTAAAALATASISLSPSSSSSSSAPSVGSGRQRLRLTGSKRRRMLEPRKNRRAVDNVPFFEEHDLLRLDVCCGTVFQSLSLGSACYIIDPELYRPCEKHRRRGQQQQQQVTEQQKKLLAVQQHQVSSISATTTMTTPSQAPIPTPALKKHHLFFMRQSESFPQGEIHRISPIPLNKTEAMPPTQTQTATNVQQQQQQQHSTLMLKPGVGVTPSVGLLHVGMMTATTAAAAAVATTTTTTTAVGAASPSSLSSSSNCSTSSSVATKFNDNSSDSGFDEHVLERKSVSPPTDELHLQEKKLQQRTAGGGGMQRLILASGLPISGQSQNLVLTGNEFTARFVQTPPQMLKITTAAAGNGNASGGVAATAGSQSSGNSNNKMRAIFNSANTIQHENGVTTILPASSLAASNQTAAMNAIAPSTVTITPAAANAKFILLKPSTAIGSKHSTTATTTPPEVKIA